jgi:hypothetical protein
MSKTRRKADDQVDDTLRLGATDRDSIRPTRLALNLHLVVPAASVTFPKTTSDLVP